MERDILVLILMADMVLKKTSCLSIELTPHKHSIMTWFALLTFTGVGTNLLFSHLLLSYPLPLWKATTFSQFIIHQLLDVQLCVWELCGMNPCANKDEKAAQLPHPCFSILKLCSHDCVLQGMSPFVLYRVNLYISLFVHEHLI